MFNLIFYTYISFHIYQRLWFFVFIYTGILKLRHPQLSVVKGLKKIVKILDEFFLQWSRNAA